MDFNGFLSLDPNPYVLTAVVPFYHMVLVIPKIKEINRSKFYLLPFDSAVMFIHLLSPFYFAAILKISFESTNFTDNLLKTMRIVLTGSAGREKCCFRVKCFNLTMVLYSIIMALAYTSYLGSFFTNCVDRTDFLYMCSDSRQELLDTRDNNIKFKILQNSDYIDHLLNLNMSYGYCLTSLFWYKSFGFQKSVKFLFRPVYTNEFVYGHYMRINKHSTHLERFNEYLLSMYSTGFMTYWGNQMVMKNYTRKVQSFLASENRFMTFGDLQFILVVFGCCIFIATCAFLIEVLLRWLK